MLYKRFIKKEPLRRDPYHLPVPEVENWYGEAMAKIEALDEKVREDREAGWQAMSDQEQMTFSEEFIVKKFGQKAITAYNPKQKLKIGLAYYLIGETE